MNYQAPEISNITELRDQILALKVRSARQKEHLQQTFLDLKDSFRPINVGRQLAHAFLNTGKNNELVQTALGLGGGMAARQLVFGRSHGITGKLWSVAVDIFLKRLGPVIGRSGDKDASPFWLRLVTRQSGNPVIRPAKAGPRLRSPVALLPASTTVEKTGILV